MNPPRPSWPSGFILFFDPSSSHATKLGKELANRLPTSAPLTTSTLTNATHVVLDAPSAFGDALLLVPPSSSSSRPPQHLVTIAWVYQSLVHSAWEREEEYPFVSEVAREWEEKGVAGGGGKGEEEERARVPESVEVPSSSSSVSSDAVPQEPSDTSLKPIKEEVAEVNVDHQPSVQDLPRLWIAAEDDALALFLLSIENNDLTTKDENGFDAFDRFAATENTRRSAKVCRNHYKGWKQTIEALMDKLSGGQTREKVKKVKKIKLSMKVATTPAVAVVDGSAKKEETQYTFIAYTPPVYQSNQIDLADLVRTRKALPAAWSPSEEAALVRLLANNGVCASAYRALQLELPSKSFETIKKYHYNHKLRIDAAVDTLRREMSSSSLSSSSGSSSAALSPILEPSNVNVVNSDSLLDLHPTSVSPSVSRLETSIPLESPSSTKVWKSAPLNVSVKLPQRARTTSTEWDRSSRCSSFVASSKNGLTPASALVFIQIDWLSIKRRVRRGSRGRTGRRRRDGSAIERDLEASRRVSSLPRSFTDFLFYLSFCSRSPTTIDHDLKSIPPSPPVTTTTTKNLAPPRETRSQASSAPLRRRWDNNKLGTSDESFQHPQKKPRLVLQLRNISPSSPSSLVASGSSSNNPLPPPPPIGSSSISQSSLKHVHLHLHGRTLPRTAHSDTSSSSLGTPSSLQDPHRRALEPTSFLILGTSPSSCVPPSSFCWWCGSDSSPSFTPFYLAAPSESDPRELVKIAGRLTCEGCATWFETRTRSGGDFLEGVRGVKSELERLSWAREKMEERGKGERRKRVVG